MHDIRDGEPARARSPRDRLTVQRPRLAQAGRNRPFDADPRRAYGCARPSPPVMRATPHWEMWRASGLGRGTATAGRSFLKPMPEV